MSSVEKNSRWLWIFTGWVLLIFATSSTVIRTDELLRWLESLTSLGPDSMRELELFWAASWFFVVKGWHVTEFLVLTVLLGRFVETWRGELTRHDLACVMLFGFLFAASDEWHQSFVPDRHGTIQDSLIDGVGVCLAGLWLFRRTRLQRKPEAETTQESDV